MSQELNEALIGISRIARQKGIEHLPDTVECPEKAYVEYGLRLVKKGIAHDIVEQVLAEEAKRLLAIQEKQYRKVVFSLKETARGTCSTIVEEFVNEHS